MATASVRTITYGDSFCGGGGSAAGARSAVDRLNDRITAFHRTRGAGEKRAVRPRLLRFELAGAINHDPVAISTHRMAHPEAHDRHFCTGVDDIDLAKVYPLGMDLYWASPSCSEHSYCNRGKAVDATSRDSAWHVINVARICKPRRIIVENVWPFTRWTEAFDANGEPIRSRTGETFREWVAELRVLGYHVEWRQINSADFGVPQSRSRFYAQARRDGLPIVWPEPTHDRYGRDGLPYWSGAINVIDPTIPAQSLYLRTLKDRPSEKTMARIIEGLRRYTVPKLTEALQTDEIAETIISSFIVPLRKNGIAKELSAPIPTITASAGNQLYLAAASLEPFLVAHFGERPRQTPRTRSSREPLWTVTGRGAGDVVIPSLEPFVLGQHGGGTARPASRPLPTIATDAFIRLFEPFVEPVDGACHDDPRPIIADRDGNLWRFDVTFRPLCVGELAVGQSFPRDYQFAGTQTDAKRMIGNAVSKDVADYLVCASLYDIVDLRDVDNLRQSA